jgi:phosphoglycolate phosphatase-like HAD superfamily hydrolase
MKRVMDVVMSDFDGVVVNSIPTTISVCVECIGNFFPTEGLKERAKGLVASFGGRSFASTLETTLETLYPGEKNKKDREKCCRMILARRKSIYDQAKAFPGALKELSKIVRNYHLVLSSSLERTIIYNWLERAGFVKGLFEAIYGLEDGGKDIHVQLVRESFPGATMFYIGDSCSDMKLGDLAIGITPDFWIREQLFQAGARAVIESIRSSERALTVLSRHKKMFLCKRAAP